MRGEMGAQLSKISFRRGGMGQKKKEERGIDYFQFCTRYVLDLWLLDVKIHI